MDKETDCQSGNSAETAETCAAPPTDKDSLQSLVKDEQAASSDKDSLEGLVGLLKQQIASSDFLEKNTTEKWKQENPDLAKEFLKEDMEKS